MHSNPYGQVFRSEKEVIDLLYQNPDLDISKINFENQEVVDKFNAASKLCDLVINAHKENTPSLPLKEFDKANQDNWHMPDFYKNEDIGVWLLEKCQTQQERERVILELELFLKHNMIDLLNYMRYLVDTLRKNNIVWGVGRGSSVASYCLYLIGVHKVNSIKYNLDIGEFLK